VLVDLSVLLHPCACARATGTHTPLARSYPPLLLGVHDFLDELLIVVDHDGRVNAGEEGLAVELDHKELRKGERGNG